MVSSTSRFAADACRPQDAVCSRPAPAWQSVNAADVDFYTEPHRSVSAPSMRPDCLQCCDFNSSYRRPRTDYYEEARDVGRGSYPDAPVYFEEPFVGRRPPSTMC
ncbi:hypothetical protein HPB50_023796 [Hyalomma asiaticum]|uniref:Uncharacterized protein n=1 Tax=Hyalomma asiaticum TaxID=266040 RepID=A0ACB7SNS9_HYAAI|nr:hypothetical protein HPB50_023796 [Hyalomma asiaticum]